MEEERRMRETKFKRDKKLALILLGVFLGFMAVCTVVSKGIYTSGLPRVNCLKPYSTGIAHTIRVNATVRQGEEYGIYVEEGLRVALVPVGKGDSFEAGQGLFQVETGDLEDIVAECRLALSKLEALGADAAEEEEADSREKRLQAERAREDYQAAVVAADALIQSRRLALEAAQTALALYDEHLTLVAAGGGHDYDQNYSRQEKRAQMVQEAEGLALALEEAKREGESRIRTAEAALEAARTALAHYEEYLSRAQAEEGYDYEKAYAAQEKRDQLVQRVQECSLALEEAKREGESGVRTAERAWEAALAALNRYDEYLAQTSPWEGDDYEQDYARQEKRAQLVSQVEACRVSLEDAEREKEAGLRAAERALEDAQASARNTGKGTEADLLALEADQQRKRLERLEELMDAQGWVYAPDAGRVVDCRLHVGERTQDQAGILYARDDGERILEAVFTQDEAKYLFEGTEFTISSAVHSGAGVSGTVLLEYLEKEEGGAFHGKLSMEGLSLAIGQTVELSCQTQTSIYNTCVPRECIFQEGEDRYYVYVAEEKEGILGTEWRLRKVGVTILDENDTVAAVQSTGLSTQSWVVSGSDKELKDGAVVRVL